jgi:hypothetical protein
MAASVLPHANDVDLLGFESSNPTGKALLWFDTEQSRYDHQQCVSRALRRAGLNPADKPNWFHSFCLTGMSYSEAWAFVLAAITKFSREHGGVQSALLDGTADFVRDVNDPEECNAFVAGMHALAIKHDSHFVNILHLNPGSVKSRGHLGSQLERKSETNLTLEKEEDETVMFATKNRRAPIPRSTGPRFRFDANAMMHITVRSHESAEFLMELGKAERAFGNHPSMRRADLERAVMEHLTLGDTAAYNRVSKWIKMHLIRKDVCGLYVLARNH